MWPQVRDQRPLLFILAGLVAVAWGVLWAWGQSPYSRFLDHAALAEVPPPQVPLFFLASLAGWTLMIAAMMLPTSLPLLALFHAMVRRRANAGQLVAALVAGYLGIWVLFGVLAHLGDLGLHAVVDSLPVLERNGPLIPAFVFLGAGLYQFTPLKHLCLEKCRSPLSFIMSHWSGQRETWGAFRLGIHHGLFCLGCCWTLMLLMFAVGTGNLGWMLLLGAAMAVEKNVPWGRRLVVPLGAALLAAGIVLLL